MPPSRQAAPSFRHPSQEHIDSSFQAFFPNEPTTVDRHFLGIPAEDDDYPRGFVGADLSSQVTSASIESYQNPSDELAGSHYPACFTDNPFPAFTASQSSQVYTPRSTQSLMPLHQYQSSTQDGTDQIRTPFSSDANYSARQTPSSPLWHHTHSKSPVSKVLTPSISSPAANKASPGMFDPLEDLNSAQHFDYGESQPSLEGEHSAPYLHNLEVFEDAVGQQHNSLQPEGASMILNEQTREYETYNRVSLTHFLTKTSTKSPSVSIH